jgi:hypothetical protein
MSDGQGIVDSPSCGAVTWGCFAGARAARHALSGARSRGTAAFPCARSCPFGWCEASGSAGRGTVGPECLLSCRLSGASAGWLTLHRSRLHLDTRRCRSWVAGIQSGNAPVWVSSVGHRAALRIRLYRPAVLSSRCDTSGISSLRSWRLLKLRGIRLASVRSRGYRAP